MNIIIPQNGEKVETKNIPTELRQRPQWVLWRAESSTKVPYRVTGAKASSTNPEHWATFDEAAAVVGDYSGVGFVFTPDDDYVGVDLDDCRNAETGELDPWAAEVVDDLATYGEVSPSQRGVKLFCRGALPGDGSGRKTPVEGGAIEAYQHSRYFTVTGNPVNGCREVCDCNGSLDKLWRQYFGDATTKTAGKLHPEPESFATSTEVAEVASHVLTLPEAISGQAGSDATVHAACEIRRRGVYGDAGRALLGMFNEQRCKPPWSDKELDRKWDAARKFVPPAGAEFDVIVSEGNDKTSLITPPGKFALTELGNAERMALHFGAELRYVAAWKSWLIWDGSRWKPDATGRVVKRAKRVVRSITQEAAATSDDDGRAKLMKWALASERRNSIANMVALAESEDAFAISPEVLDAHPWLLNCNNGTVDLHTGELRKHDKADLLTKSTGVNIAPSGQSPLWESFLTRIFKGDAELIGYLQRLLGYSLVGEVREHVLPIFHGSGANGKSTLIEVAMVGFGDYAMKAPANFLISRRGEAHPTELADLFGCRLTAAVETGDGQRLDETRVKEITGGDTIRARRMRQDFWQFEPTHTVIVVSEPQAPRLRHGQRHLAPASPGAVRRADTKGRAG